LLFFASLTSGKKGPGPFFFIEAGREAGSFLNIRSAARTAIQSRICRENCNEI